MNKPKKLKKKLAKKAVEYIELHEGMNNQLQRTALHDINSLRMDISRIEAMDAGTQLQELMKAARLIGGCSKVIALRNKLKAHVSYEDGKLIRKELRAFSIKNYIQKYSDSEHIGFIKRHRISTKAVHPQSTNSPYYYEMFSVVTQHIYADTIEELFDKAIDIEKKENKN